MREIPGFVSIIMVSIVERWCIATDRKESGDKVNNEIINRLFDLIQRIRSKLVDLQ